MSSSVPYDAFHCWFKREFEQLGWMVLALVKAKKGDSHCAKKIEMYKESLEHLKIKLIGAQSEIKEEDRLRDLRIYVEDVEYLIKFVNKNLNISSLEGGAKKRKSKKSKLSRK
jgi:hypothetical protein